jgi:hypothetical protein
MTRTFIQQTDHYRKSGFGNVLRSSGIFYYRRDENFQTTVTFMNYWKVKRDLDVTVLASLRDMEGCLISREELPFDQGQVRNYAPEAPTQSFEGSVEIEVFALQNMVIPFAAIIAVYETDLAVSMTHNYARSYSSHEIEEGRTITDGEESCWTLRDGQGTRSFAIFHNGIDRQPAQTASFTVTRADGERRNVDFALPDLPSYASYKFVPADHFPDLDGYLDGQPGNGSLSYKLNKAFTRMLIGNERAATGDMQVTHSNFNYSRHKTDEVDRPGAAAFMMMPDGGIEGYRVRVYPDSDIGDYQITNSDGTRFDFANTDIIEVPAPSGEITFRKVAGGLPTRLVTAIVGNPGDGLLPFELSLGVLHEARPPKRMWWAPTVSDATRDGAVVATCYEELYGPYEGQPVNIKLYSQETHDVIETDLDEAQVRRANIGLPLDEILPGASKHLGGNIGWFTWYSEYGGFQVFTKLARPGGNYAMEHGF